MTTVYCGALTVKFIVHFCRVIRRVGERINKRSLLTSGISKRKSLNIEEQVVRKTMEKTAILDFGYN